MCVTLPTPYIKLYDEDDKLTGYKYFDNLDHEPMDTTTTQTEKNDTVEEDTLMPTAQQQKYQTHRVISQVQLA